MDRSFAEALKIYDKYSVFKNLRAECAFSNFSQFTSDKKEQLFVVSSCLATMCLNERKAPFEDFTLTSSFNAFRHLQIGRIPLSLKVLLFHPLPETNLLGCQF